ncbi:efflux RND transporter permease subunit [Garciella nitratireducens]|uniref:efflux RND transporter permease subunit n=1 Tax=Garciella nitratireducens TaxID=218205 RepID=UPI001BD4D683|nr:efflux RND transporter permease subunit [Garciella nitratireducens]
MLPTLSVKKPYTVFVAVILVLILGVISFTSLQTDLLPSLDLPYIVIMTSYPGASPEEVEMAVTKPIEQVLATTSNIKNINSISSPNTSMVILEFNNDANMDSAMIEIDGNLDLLKPKWNESIGTPTVMKLNPDMLPIMVTAIDVKGMNTSQVSNLVRNKVIPQLESVEGVASVSGNGLLEEEIQVQLDSKKIEDLNKKILNKVDSDLAQAENQLTNAKSEMNSKLDQLKAEEKKQREKLEEGEKALQSARAQLESGKSQLNMAQASIQVFDIAEKELEQLKLNYENSKEKLDEKATKEIMDHVTSSIYQQLGENISSEQQQSIQMVGQILSNVYQQSNQTIITAIDQGIKNLNSQKSKMIAEVNTQKQSLASAEKQLQEKEKQLQSGKDALDEKMQEAKKQLEKGQSELDEQMKQLEASKEEAFQKADLEGVLTEEMISNILSAQNFSMPAGYVKEKGMDYVVKVGDKIKNPKEIEELLLFDTKVDGVGKIYLKDVANVQKTNNAEEIYAKINGQDGVVLTFQKQSNYSTAEVSKNLKNKFEELSKEIEGLTATHLMDQGIYIDLVIHSVLSNLISGAILAILILLLFLRDYKPTFIIALSIPISLIFAIALMYFTGVSMNIISLGGLALGVGMLVDNSIVVIENVYRLKSQGLPIKEASIEGAKQVSGALAASTLTTIAVFLPIVFIEGISRQLLMDMGLTIAYSLIASLIVALTLVPVLTSGIFRNVKDKQHGFFDKLIKIYETTLTKALNHKLIVIMVVIGLLIFSGISAFNMGTSFIPEMAGNEMSITMKIEEGSSFDDKKKMANQVIDRIMDIQGIETIGAFSSNGMSIGAFGGGTSSGEEISMYLLLDEDRKVSNTEIAKEITNKTKDLKADIKVSTTNMDLGAIAGSGIEVNIQGNDIDTLRKISEDVAKMIKDTKGTTEVTTNFDDNTLEIRVTVDKEKAMEKGLTVAQVYSNINGQLSEGKSATTINMENRDYPVIVVNDKKETITRDTLKDLEIKAEKDGEETVVRLGDIAKINQVKSLSSIHRDAQKRYVSVSTDVDSGHNIGLVSKELNKKLENYEVPEGYTIKIAGETETINTTIQDLLKMILLAVVFVYLIMVAQFQSLLSPFIVMFTIPLAATGGILALLITGKEISMISLLGFLVLSGIVVNNGIVFVDYTNQLRESGLEKKAALIETGKIRLRPILMTAITTILGLSTLALGIGMGAEMLQPLAIVAVGGLIYATILTLLVIPTMYDIFVRDKKDNPNKEI